MRTAEIKRDTTETQIDLRLNLDDGSAVEIATGAGFLDHMLTLFARHGRFGLVVRAAGDLHVDAHHVTEDVGIVLGRAFAQALGDMRGIARYGSFLMPMDESLVQLALDISGRPLLVFGMRFPSPKIGDFDTELVEEFYQGFVRGLGATLHILQLAGQNSHHIAEASFKGFGRALRQAVTVDNAAAGEIPSTKGTLL